MVHALPVIALDQYTTPEQLAKPLHAACTDSGFFYLTYHGAEELIKQAFEIAQEYFLHSKDDEKARFPYSMETGLGHGGFRKESLDPSSSTNGDVKETFNTAHPSSGLQDFPPAFQTQIDVITRYIDAMHEISLKVLAGLALALNLPPQQFTKCHNGVEDRCRFIHYPPVSNFQGSQDIRASQHSDYGSITLLATNSVGGLQVLTKQNTWSDVPHLEGALVVNIADALEFWSGGIFKSTVHRVAIPRDAREAVSRFSIAYFVQPDADTTLQVLTGSDFSDAEFDARVAAKGVEPGTRRMSSKEFLMARFHRSQLKQTAVGG